MPVPAPKNMFSPAKLGRNVDDHQHINLYFFNIVGELPMVSQAAD